MKIPVKLGVFALTLLVVFGAAWGAGRLAGPRTTPATAEPEHGQQHDAAAALVSSKVPGGLQISQDGYRLELAAKQLSTVDEKPLTFRIIGPDGKPVTAYTTEHEKDLHLIVVRRDLTSFQHVHPVLSADGLWSVPLKLAAPGPYRVFADFKPAASESGLILGADINVPGDFQPRTFQPQTDTGDGEYDVTLRGDLVPGTSSKLTLTVSKGGKPVTDLQPYLGAFGHLVVLRDGDLAYLHVHPQESTAAGPQIVFYAEVPSAGAYGLFLDFQHEGRVHTASFTAPTAGIAPAPVGTKSPGHGH